MQIPITTMVLAGGSGRRMNSDRQKVLHELCGRPMMEWALEAARMPGADEELPPIALVGFHSEQVQEQYGERLRYVRQTRSRGSGSALLDARELLKGLHGRLLVLAGDLPLLHKESIQQLVSCQGSAAFLTSILEDAEGYGRVERYMGEHVVGVIEEEDLSGNQREIKEVRVSAYCFDMETLLPVLDSIAGRAGEGECSMTEILNGFLEQGLAVDTVSIPAEEAMGINDRVQLAACAKVLRRRINQKHMLAGVTLIDPDNTFIDYTVKIGRDSVIYPGVVLQGNTVIGEGTTLFPACRIIDSHLGDFVQAQGLVARDAVVGNAVTLGPYVNLRPGARLDDRVKVGNYIEVKNAMVGEGSKLPHLSYIGDGDIGKNSNLGCGTVFVNYDGYKKHRTKIGDNAFIGCHTSLVAPVSVGNGAFTAAGSVITEDVPDETLAVARAKQVNKLGYMTKLRKKRGDG